MRVTGGDAHQQLRQRLGEPIFIVRRVGNLHLGDTGDLRRRLGGGVAPVTGDEHVHLPPGPPG